MSSWITASIFSTNTAPARQFVWNNQGITGAKKCHCRFASCGKVCSEMEKENQQISTSSAPVQTQLMSSVYRACHPLYRRLLHCSRTKRTGFKTEQTDAIFCELFHHSACPAKQRQRGDKSQKMCFQRKKRIKACMNRKRTPAPATQVTRLQFYTKQHESAPATAALTDRCTVPMADFVPARKQPAPPRSNFPTSTSLQLTCSQPPPKYSHENTSFKTAVFFNIPQKLECGFDADAFTRSFSPG